MHTFAIQILIIINKMENLKQIILKACIVSCLGAWIAFIGFGLMEAF